jgi:RND family efflux transporter MFP subunit
MSSPSDRPRRFTYRGIIVVVVLVLIAVLLAVAVKKGRQRLASAPRWQPRPVPVSVKPVERAVVRQTISYLARLEPLATAEIAPQVSARIEEILVDEGNSVEAGQLLARLDDRDIKAQIRGLEAKIAAQDARLRGNKAALDAARQSVAFLRREFERDQRLFNEKGTSASALESSRNLLDTAIGKLQGLEQDEISIGHERKALAAQLEEARTRLSYTEVRSPSSGVVRRCYAEVGDMAKAGGALFSLMDYACHRLAFDLVQEDLMRVAPGQPVLVRWPGDVEPPVMQPEGSPIKLTRIFPSLETGKTVRAEVDLYCQLSGSLRIGSFVPIEIVVREAEGLAVGRSAVIPMEGGGSAVYAVRDGALDLVRVKKVLSDERLALIEGELKEGDQVAVGEYLQWVRRSREQLVEVRP